MKLNFKKLFSAFVLLTISWVFVGATYYIDSSNGSDGNNGTTPVAGTTNGPWQHIAKYMRTNGASGDTAYMAPGVYREGVTVIVTSPTATTKLIGDPQNTRGFKTSGSILVSPGLVRWSGFTNDLVATSSIGSVLLLNGSDYWQFENIFFNVGLLNTVCIDASTTTSTNIVLTNCVIQSMLQRPLSVTAAFGVPLNWRISNCKFISFPNNDILITHTSGTGSDWNLNFLIENSELLTSGTAIQVTKAGTAVNVGGGVLVTNCSMFTGVAMAVTGTSTNNFTNYVINCFIAASIGLTAGDLSQISENYNWFNCTTPRTTVNTGANSKSALNPIVDFDMSRLFGFGPRPLLSPHSTSPMIGLGTTAENVDLFGKTRPSPNTMGAYETYGNVETSHSFAQ